MNSSAWLVSSGAERYVLKISDASEEPGLQVAAWLEARGLRTGAPMHMTVRDGRLVALLRFADGRPLATSHADVEALRGDPRARPLVARRMRRCRGALQRWPWSWLDSGVIDDPDLRAAATDAIDAAERLAATLTLGILHGDPAPEAFLAGRGRCRADRLGSRLPWSAPVRRRLGPDATPATSSSPHTGGPPRSRPMSWRPSPCYWPSGGPSRRGTSRGESDGAISPGCCPTRTTTKALADARRALLGSAFLRSVENRWRARQREQPGRRARGVA